MDNVSRPLIALLVGSVAFFAVWMVALKPSSSPSGSSGGGSSANHSAVAKAHQAVATSNGASVAHGGVIAGTGPATAPAVVAHPAVKAAIPVRPVAPRHVAATAGQRRSVVARALRADKVLALLFYNRAAADDRAIKQELAAVPSHRSHVVKLAVPLIELSQYAVVTTQVPVSSSPTLVLIDRTQHASTIVGFADRFEIAQRVDDALAAK